MEPEVEASTSPTSEYAEEEEAPAETITSIQTTTNTTRQKTRVVPPRLVISRSPSLASSQVGGVWGDDRWQIVEFGTPGSLRYRMLFVNRKDGREMSPWHQIPLFAGSNNLNFLCKTPRGSWAKYEIGDNEHFTPLRLTSKQGWPAHFTSNATWNYGMLPQTWADPTLQNEQYKSVVYDGRPMEVVEIGSRSSWTGEVYQVKPLGAFAVIEGPHLSWKIIAIAADDPMAGILKSVNDINRSLPGMLDEIREWLRTCNCLDSDDVEGQFGLYELPAEHEETIRQIEIAHKSWQILSAHQIAPDPSFSRLKPMKASTYELMWVKYTESCSDASIPLSDFGLGTKWKRGKSNETSISTPSTPSKHRRELLSFLRPKNKPAGTPVTTKTFSPTAPTEEEIDHAVKSSRCGLNLFIRSAEDDSLSSTSRRDHSHRSLDKNNSWDEKNMRSLMSPHSDVSNSSPKPRYGRLISHGSWDSSRFDLRSPSRPVSHMPQSASDPRPDEKSHSDQDSESPVNRGKRSETSRLLKNRLRGNVSLGINIPDKADATQIFRQSSSTGDKKSVTENGPGSAQSTPNSQTHHKPVPISPSLMSPKSWLSAIGFTNPLSPGRISSPRNALKSRDLRGLDSDRSERGERVWCAGGMDSPDSSKLWNLGGFVSSKMKFEKLNSPKGSLDSPGRGTIGGTAIARMVKDFNVDGKDMSHGGVPLSPGSGRRFDDVRNGRYMGSDYGESWKSPINDVGSQAKILRTSSMPVSFENKKDSSVWDGLGSAQTSPSGHSMYDQEGTWQNPDDSGKLIRTRSQGRRVTFSEKVQVKLFKSESRNNRNPERRKEAEEGEEANKVKGREGKDGEEENGRTKTDDFRVSFGPSNGYARREMQQKMNGRIYRGVNPPSLRSTASQRKESGNPGDYEWESAFDNIARSGWGDVQDSDEDDKKRISDRERDRTRDGKYGMSKGSEDEYPKKISPRSDALLARLDYHSNPRFDYGGAGFIGRPGFQNLSPLNPLSRANAEAREKERAERERIERERGERERGAYHNSSMMQYPRGRRMDQSYDQRSPDNWSGGSGGPIASGGMTSRPRPGSGELIPSLGRRFLARKVIRGGSGELLPASDVSPITSPIGLRRVGSATLDDMQAFRRDEVELLMMNKKPSGAKVEVRNGTKVEIRTGTKGEVRNGGIQRIREDYIRGGVGSRGEEKRERVGLREEGYYREDSNGSWTRNSPNSPQHHVLKLNLLERQRDQKNKELLHGKKWDLKEIGEMQDDEKNGGKLNHVQKNPNGIRMVGGGRLSMQPFTVYVS